MFFTKKRPQEILQKQRLYASLNTRMFAFAIDLMLFAVAALPILYLTKQIPAPAPSHPGVVMEAWEYDDLDGNEVVVEQDVEIDTPPSLNEMIEQQGGLSKIALGQVLQTSAMLLISAIFIRKWGATPGKWLFSIKVISDNPSTTLTWQQAIIREFSSFFSAIALGVGVFSMVWRRDKKMWHDRWARTLVVRR